MESVEKIDNLSLSLTMNDELIATLHLKAGVGEELLADAADEGILYDADEQEDLQKYVAEVNPEAIFENCRKAGVPDDFIEQIAGFVMQMMQSSQEQPAGADQGSLQPSTQQEQPIDAG